MSEENFSGTRSVAEKVADLDARTERNWREFLEAVEVAKAEVRELNGEDSEWL